jgi:hypothetical protein
MRHGDLVEQQLDARLFLLAVRELLYAVHMELSAVKRLAPHARKPLAAALAAFNRSVPGLTEARDVIVHFGEYARGGGKLQQNLIHEGANAVEVARDFWPFGYDPHTGKIQIGPYLIDAEEAYAAARQLVHAVAVAAWQIDAQGDQGSSIQGESQASPI